MLLVHYSDTPLTAVRDASQFGHRAGRARLGFKPNGLWVSVEGPMGWAEWCRDNEFRLDRLACATQIVLNPAARILSIASVPGLREFSDRYAAPWRKSMPLHAIDWGRVAREYQGIVIVPYQTSVRFELPWYSSWDCASGCVWDAGAIESVRPANG